MLSPIGHVRSRRERKPIICRQCDEPHILDWKSLFRGHSTAGPPNSNERDKEYQNGSDIRGAFYGFSVESKLSGCQMYTRVTGKKCDHRLPSATPRQNETFNCDECGSTYKKRGYLRRHKARVHRDGGGKSAPFDGPDEPITPNCEEKYSLEMRSRSVYAEEVAIFACDKCGKSFKRKFTLRVHSSLCVRGKGTSGSELLTVERSPVWPFKEVFTCLECGATFNQMWNFQQHLIGFHNEGKPFSCAECGKTYKRRHTLRMHCKTELHRETVECRPDTVRYEFESRSEELEMESLPPPRDSARARADTVKEKVGRKGRKLSARKRLLVQDESTSIRVDTTSDARRINEVDGNFRRVERVASRREARVCSSCRKAYEEYDELIKHAKTCKKYNQLIEKLRTTVVSKSRRPDRRRKYECGACKLRVPGARQLNVHLKEVHGINFFFHLCDERISCRQTYPRSFPTP